VFQNISIIENTISMYKSCSNWDFDIVVLKSKTIQWASILKLVMFPMSYKCYEVLEKPFENFRNWAF
jgi:hypothetical protein